MFHLVSLSKIPSNAFNDVPPTVSGPKNVARPVYLTKNARHKYAEFIMQVGKNTKHSFSDIQKAAKKMKNLHRQVLHAEDKTIISWTSLSY